MKLWPVSKDSKPDYWFCINCQKKITLEDRDRVWEQAIDDIIKKYNLKDFAYYAG